MQSKWLGSVLISVSISASLSVLASNRAGDADNSGTVSLSDAALVQSRLYGTASASAISPLALADADSDLDIADLMLVAQAAAGARILDNPSLALLFTPPSPMVKVSGAPDFVETFGVASPLPAVVGLVDGLEVSFAIQPASTSTLSLPSSMVLGGSASVTVSPMAPPGGESFDVVLSVPLADSSGGTPRDLTSNAPVTVAEVDTCGNGVTDLEHPTQLSLELLALPCNEITNYRVWINGTKVFDHAYPFNVNAPEYGWCEWDNCLNHPGYNSVSTSNPAHLAAVLNGTNSIRFQFDYSASGFHALAWALLKITRPNGVQYIPLYDGLYPEGALAHDLLFCLYILEYSMDSTSNYEINLMEDCDSGLSNGTCGNCNASCTGPYNTCGDLVVQCGEVCDDGPGGSCNDDCSGGFCGDGVVYGSEACDSGPDNGTCGFCRSNCTGPYNVCGDSQTLCGEACDDGPGGTCHDDCTAVNVCGDGLVFAGEICDDGVDNGTCGYCNATCNGPHNVCGDNQILCGEACDDGDATECGLCNATCTGPSPADFCGDGVRCGAEVCDDGDNSPCGLCNPWCTATSPPDTCGDGVVCGAETCDDGNTVANDGCEPGCQLICGAASGADRAFVDAASGDCFLGFDDTNDWQDSQALCQAVSDGLATPASASGNAAAFLAATSSDAWIGISDLTSEAGSNGTLFQYVNGGYVSYNGWVPGEPNGGYAENCVQFFPSAGGAWNDSTCWSERSRVCEITHCGNGIVDPGETCDDGDGSDCGPCLADCSGPSIHCGNGVLDCEETCEDGNTLDGDGCESDCQLACGAGTGAGRAFWDPGNNTCYLGFTNPMNYASSQSSCASLGGYLAIIDSALENAKAFTTFQVDSWIGFNDIVSEAGSNPFSFLNVLGGPLVYSGFGPGEPNNSGGNEDCVQFFSATNMWNDADCGGTAGRICEIPAATGVCGDGVHNLGEACDDGDTSDCGTCNADCTMAQLPDFCGDGRLCGGETCDDGDNTECGDCNASCSGPSNHCGNGALDCGEACDDGNLTDADGCESDCGLACGTGTGAWRATFDTGNNTCYLGFVSETNYLSSQAACTSLGGYLAIIDSMVENALAYQAAQASMWIGFNDMGVEAGSNPYGFVNVLGGPLTYANFSPGEPNDYNGEDCVQFYGGSLWNDIDCSDSVFDLVHGYLCEIPAAFGVCGDGVRNLDEACDDGDTTECGTCNPTCTGSSPADTCGDGLVCGAEVCDDGLYNGTCGNCNNSCGGPFNACGDGIARCGEVCDDGNLDDGDGCESDCQLACGAGSGAVRAVLDGGANTCYIGLAGSADYATRKAQCEGADGYLAIIDSAAENSLAQTVNLGDAYIGFNDIASEAGSNAFLFKNVLGGNLIYNGFGPGEPNDFGGNEDCVVMNAMGLWNDVSVSWNGPAICELPNALGYCGDGVVNPGEDCDDRVNGNNCDGCTDDCQSTLIYCGNQTLECYEACDDGPVQGPGLCLNNCSGLQVCGDGVINGTENCDDWNALNDDGCSSLCQLEPQPCLPTSVAVFGEIPDYDVDTIASTLAAAAIPHAVFHTSSLGSVDLSPFDKVVFPSGQGAAFLAAVQANATWLGNWIAAGGVFEFHFADWVGSGTNFISMPGGWSYRTIVYADPNWDLNDTAIANETHFLHRFPTSMTLNDYKVVGNYGDWNPPDAGGYIQSFPGGTLWLVWDTDEVRPTTALMPYGLGYTIASGHIVEWMARGVPGFATIGPNGQQMLRNLLEFMPPQTCP